MNIPLNSCLEVSISSAVFSAVKEDVVKISKAVFSNPAKYTLTTFIEENEVSNTFASAVMSAICSMLSLLTLFGAIISVSD